MNTSSAALQPATLGDDAWDDLLSFIEERREVPIVGPELLRVKMERCGRQATPESVRRAAEFMRGRAG